jgi:hypothetical protein
MQLRTQLLSSMAVFLWGAASVWAAGAPAQEVDPPVVYVSSNGDVNADGHRNVGDAIALLDWLYGGGPEPAPMACELQAPDVENGDLNGDLATDVSDVVFLLSWLFRGGAAPVSACGSESDGRDGAEGLRAKPAGEDEGAGGNFQPRLRIISPHARYQGRTYGEWTALWWRWAITLPVDGHPFFDPNACDKGQHGPVWFLSGAFGDPQARECTIPLGKAILFPVINAECSTVEPPPFFGSNEAELRTCAADFMSGATDMTASLDGQEVRHLRRYRVDSPLFGINYPENNIFGVPGPGSALSVSDGVWILLAPPDEGDYTIHFAGSIPGASLDTTYTIHIVDTSDPRVVPVDASIAGKTYGDWGAEWWKLVYSIPLDQNPVPADSSGCLPDQNGPVYFLFGTFGGTVERTCTVPERRKVFIPLLNIFNDYPCPDPSFAPAEGQSLEDFLAAAYDPVFTTGVTELIAELDGEPIPNLAAYRATSRLATFRGDLSHTALDPCITGEKQYAVADGYWLILQPLSPGQHTLRFGGAFDFFGTPFSLDVTYHLDVDHP